MLLQTTCSHLTVFEADTLRNGTEAKQQHPYWSQWPYQAYLKPAREEEIRSKGNEYTRCKWRQNLDEDLLTFLFWFEFNFIISCLQFHSLFFLFLSWVVFEVPSKPGSFQPVWILLTALRSKPIWIIVIFSLQERLCMASLEFLGQKSNQLPTDFSYCLLFVFEISQKRKIIFCTVHLGTIDGVYETSRNLRCT